MSNKYFAIALDLIGKRLRVRDAGAEGAVVVTPSDALDLARGATNALYLSSAGDVKVTLASGDQFTFVGLTAGWHPISAKKVWATGTTVSAGGIGAIY